MMRKLLERPRAVAGLSLTYIETDSRLFEARDERYSLHLLEAGALGRDRAESFIREAYRREFDARLSSFYPGILSLSSHDGRLVGAVGVRYAESHDLFLEQYFHERVETRLSDVAGRLARRGDIIELGNLCVQRPALTYPLMNLIGSWLHSYQVEWMVFALTGKLRRLFERSGVEMLELGSARQARLADDGNDWGSYYDNDPRIMAVYLPSALVVFQRRHASGRRARQMPRVAMQRVPA